MFGSEPLTIIMGIAAVLATWAACHVIFTMRVNTLLCKAGAALLPVTALLLIVAGLHFDVFGYDRHLPELDKLDALTIRGLNENYQYDVFDLTRDGTLASGYEWAQHMAQEALSNREFGMRHDVDITIGYHVGRKTISRKYPILRGENEQPLIRTILAGEEYRAMLLHDEEMEAFRAATHDSEWKASAEVNMNCIYWRHDAAYLESLGLNSDSFNVNLGYSFDYDRLLAAFEHDVANRTADDMQGRPIAEINFRCNDSNTWYNVIRMLYPCDMETLSIVYGDKVDAIVRYALVDWAASPDIIMLHQTRGEDRKDFAVEAVSEDHIWTIAKTGYSRSQAFWNKPELRTDENYAVFSRDEFEVSTAVRFETGAEYADYITKNGLIESYSCSEISVKK